MIKPQQDIHTPKQDEILVYYSDRVDTPPAPAERARD
jgi:hypothetical protein